MRYFPVASLSGTLQDTIAFTLQRYVVKCVPDHLSKWFEWSDHNASWSYAWSFLATALQKVRRCVWKGTSLSSATSNVKWYTRNKTQHGQNTPIYLVSKSSTFLLSDTKHTEALSLKTFCHHCDRCHELHLRLKTVALHSKLFFSLKI